ncbi:alpha/beta hydrolase, partial [Mariniblastus sp.]|nr:alpha/beta hydrolase [Mariniblastus sp.]
MNLLKKYLSFVCLIGVTLVPLTAQPAHADIVTVLFTGFLSPVAGSGMEALNFELSDRFESSELQLDYSGQAFQYTQREDALDYISGIDNIDYLILIGHSFGGSSAIQLAENFLAPNGINVDLTFQIDSV